MLHFLAILYIFLLIIRVFVLLILQHFCFNYTICIMLMFWYFLKHLNNLFCHLGTRSFILASLHHSLPINRIANVFLVCNVIYFINLIDLNNLLFFSLWFMFYWRGRGPVASRWRFDLTSRLRLAEIPDCAALRCAASAAVVFCRRRRRTLTKHWAERSAAECLIQVSKAIERQSGRAAEKPSRWAVEQLSSSWAGS